MDKLQWFKFTPSDWMMGKIQRCPEVTQARFMRICCLYWNKECNLSIEDAEIEIDKEHFDILIAKKIISKNETYFNISFLDEQFLEIQESSNDKSKSGIIGNLKRWHLAIYNDYEAKKISLEEAIKRSKVIADQSQPDGNPIATQSQPNRKTSQRREEEIREEEIREDKNIQEVLLEKETKVFTFKNALLELGVDKKIVDDYLKVRKTKNAVNSETAFNKITNEIALTNKTANEIITICVERSWSGFNAEWITNNFSKKKDEPHPDWNGGNTPSGILI
jgi:hypothetical protein